MKKVFFLILLTPSIIFAQTDVILSGKRSILYGISAGANFSKLDYDTIDFNYGTFPFAGITGIFPLNRRFDIKASALYSLKGSQAETPYVKYRNTYLEFAVWPQLAISDNVRLKAGINYAEVIKSDKVILNGDNSNGREIVSVSGYPSEYNILAGFDFDLQRSVNLGFNYYIPLSERNTKNFQLSLNVLFGKRHDGEQSIRAIRRNVAREQIRELKNGVLLVRLKTSENQIKALKIMGKHEKAAQVEKQQEIDNKAIILAFKSGFDFCPVRFFYSHNSRRVKNRQFDDIFLDENLNVDNTIKIDSNKTVFIADFGMIEQDSLKYFSHYSYEHDGSTGLKKVENYYGSSNFGFDALIIRDGNFAQLSKPFPFYKRQPFKSIRKHPEAMLFIPPPLLATQSWSYAQTVNKMNQKLSRFYNRYNH